MNRNWLLTWTTYGTWLPGYERGFVSNVRDGVGPEVKHNEPGTSYDSKQRGLAISARKLMKSDEVWLTKVEAEVVSKQFQETAKYAWWTTSGSRRKLPDDDAVQATIAYVRNQNGALLTWYALNPVAHNTGSHENPVIYATSSAGEIDARV